MTTTISGKEVSTLEIIFIQIWIKELVPEDNIYTKVKQNDELKSNLEDKGYKPFLIDQT